MIHEPNSYTWIIHISLHNHRLFEYQLSLPLQRACYYLQTEHGERRRWGVATSQSVQQQYVLGLCSVRNIGHPSCHHLLDRVHSLLYTGLH